MKQVVVEGKETKNTHKIVIHLHTPVQMEKKKNRKNEKNADSDQRHRCKEQTFGHRGRTVRMDDLRERRAMKHITICKIDDGHKFDEAGHPKLVLRGIGWGGS